MKKFQEFNRSINEGFIDNFKSRFKKKVEPTTYDPELLWDKSKIIWKQIGSFNTYPCFIYLIDSMPIPNQLSHKNDIGDSVKVKFNSGSLQDTEYVGSFNRRLVSNKKLLGLNSEKQGRKNYSGKRSCFIINREPYSHKIADFSENFNNIRNISNKLGLIVGSNIYIKSIDKVEKILSIKDVCFVELLETSSEIYNTHYDECKSTRTIFYETSSGFYNSYFIEPIKEVKKIGISGPDILFQGLSDLSDSGKINFRYSIENGKSQYYKCEVDLEMDNNLMMEFFRDYEVMCHRLHDEGYDVDLVSVSMNKVVFNVKYKKANEGYIDDLKNRFRNKYEVKAGEKLIKNYNPEMLWKFQPKVDKVLNLSSNRVRCFYVAKASDVFQWRQHPENNIPSFRIKEMTESFKHKFENVYSIGPEYKLGRIGINSESQGIGNWVSSSHINIGENTDSKYLMNTDPHFDYLRNIANLLNLKIGEQVHIDPIDKLEYITDIKGVCFLQALKLEGPNGRSTTYDGIICDLTLFFETPSGIWSSYQIEPLNKEQYSKKMKIDGIDILYQGLIDLRDEGKIDFSFEIGKCKTGDFYTCTVTTNFVGVGGNKFFIEFMKDYETMCDRLSEDGYEVSLLSINHKKIQFTVKHT